MLRRISPVLVLLDTWRKWLTIRMGIKLDSAKLPAYPEALACLEEGIVTAAAHERSVRPRACRRCGDHSPLALDPQTMWTF